MTRQPRILVVEDDRVIADAVGRRLVSEGFQVDTVFDGLAAVAAVAAVDAVSGAAAGAVSGGNETRYAAVVLDVMLPGLDGHEVCRRIQAARPLPVLMLTARADETDRIVGLGVGADDYLIKPFSPRELVARVRALLRRVERAAELAAADRLASAAGSGSGPVTGGGPSRLELGGGLVLDLAGRRLERDGEQVHLTRTEFDLLHVLVRRPGQVISRDRLLAEVWAWPEASLSASGSGASGASGLGASGSKSGGATARGADSHIKALRRKIGRERIRTVHGVGYAWEPPPRDHPSPVVGS